LTEGDGEKERLSQQQSDGFAYKGTTHQVGYYYNQVRDYTDFKWSEDLRGTIYSQRP